MSQVYRDDALLDLLTDGLILWSALAALAYVYSQGAFSLRVHWISTEITQVDLPSHFRLPEVLREFLALKKIRPSCICEFTSGWLKHTAERLLLRISSSQLYSL